MQYTINYKNNGKTESLKDLILNINLEEYSDLERIDLKNEYSKICIREHRTYTFENELDFDFSDDENELKSYKELGKDYYIFDLDMFEHSCIGFSLSINRINLGWYNMDRSNNIGFIAIEKKACKDYAEAKELAKEEIELYTNYCNGWIYEYSINEKEEYFSKDLKKSIYNYDFYDGCGGFLKEDFAVEYAKEAIKYYLNQKGIEYDSIELKKEK